MRQRQVFLFLKKRKEKEKKTKEEKEKQNTCFSQIKNCHPTKRQTIKYCRTHRVLIEWVLPLVIYRHFPPTSIDHILKSKLH